MNRAADAGQPLRPRCGESSGSVPYCSIRGTSLIVFSVYLKIDEMIWNDRHPEDDPIQLVMDFTDDVEERLNSPGFGGSAQPA